MPNIINELDNILVTVVTHLSKVFESEDENPALGYLFRLAFI